MAINSGFGLFKLVNGRVLNNLYQIDVGYWPITCSHRSALGQLSSQWALRRGGPMTQRQQVVSGKNALTVLHGLFILVLN